MRSYLYLMIVVVFCAVYLRPNQTQAQSNSFLAADAKGAVGETSKLFLIEEGFFARPFYNDFYGNTDKHLTGGLNFGYTHICEKDSLESRFHWLAFTPTSYEMFGEEMLEEPVGTFADWMEIKETWAHLFEYHDEIIRVQFSLGFGHIGDHGMKQFHHDFHKFIGSPTEGLEYTDQPIGTTFSWGFEVGLIEKARTVFGLRKESMLTFGYSQNKFMWDFYVDHNEVLTWSPGIKTGLEVRMVRQTESEIFTEKQRLAWRSELALGLRFYWWRPSIKYLSPYLRGDQVGQTYLDVLSIYFKF